MISRLGYSSNEFIVFECFGTVINHAGRVFEIASQTKGNLAFVGIA